MECTLLSGSAPRTLVIFLYLSLTLGAISSHLVTLIHLDVKRGVVYLYCAEENRHVRLHNTFTTTIIVLKGECYDGGRKRSEGAIMRRDMDVEERVKTY